MQILKVRDIDKKYTSLDEIKSIDFQHSSVRNKRISI